MDTAWRFGTVVRIDWDDLGRKHGLVPPPGEDGRRWLVVAQGAPGRAWALLCLTATISGEPLISHWRSMTGFCRAEDPE